MQTYHTSVFRNEDRAGAVLQVLQELEAAEVNVGRLNVGRQEVMLNTPPWTQLDFFSSHHAFLSVR